MKVDKLKIKMAAAIWDKHLVVDHNGSAACNYCGTVEKYWHDDDCLVLDVRRYLIEKEKKEIEDGRD